MNSKMTALVAILAVGVLAAAGLGYAWSAQYISNENEISGEYLLITDLNNGAATPADVLADYSTIYDNSGDAPIAYTTGGSSTGQTPTPAVQFTLSGTAKNFKSGTNYTLALADGSKMILSDGSTITLASGTWTFAPATGTGAAPVITAWTVPTIDFTVGESGKVIAGTGSDITVKINVTIAAMEVNVAADGTISAGSAMVSDKGDTTTTIAAAGAAYIDKVSLIFNITASA